MSSRAVAARFEVISAIALGLILLFAVAVFAATQRWAQSTFQIATFALGMCWAIRYMLWPYRIRSSVLLMPIGAIVLWGLIQLELNSSVYRFVTWSAVVNWATYFVLFWVALQVFADSRLRSRFLRCVLYLGFGLSVIAIAQYFTAPGLVYWFYPTRSGGNFGPFVDRDHYAAFVELLLPLALTEALRDRRRVWLHAAIAGCLFASVIAAASRAGSLLSLLEIAVILLIAATRQLVPAEFLGRTVVKIMGFALIYTLVVGWQVLWKRFQEPDPFKYRRELNASAAQMVRARPWLGFGLGTFETAYPAYALFDAGLLVDHAHNDWAEWAAEGGLPFCALILSVLLLSLRGAFRSLWGLGIVSVFLHSTVDFPLQIPALAGLVFVLLGALAAERGVTSYQPFYYSGQKPAKSSTSSAR